MIEPPDQVYPADLNEALAIYVAWLRQAADSLAAGHTHAAYMDLLKVMASFIMWLLQHFEPQAHDDLIAETLLTIATAFLDGRNGSLHPIFVPVHPERPGARPMTVDEIRYRAFAGLASQLRHETPEGRREGVGSCDRDVEKAVAWIDDDPALFDRLGGSLTHTSVRNARVDIEHNRGPIAAYARGIPTPISTPEERAAWTRDQLTHRKGAAFAT